MIIKTYNNLLQAILSLSIRLRFRSCSSMINLSAALIGAERFLSFTDVSRPSEVVSAEDLNTLGRFRGFAFKGLTTALRGFIFSSVDTIGAVDPELAATGFAENDNTTFSEVSSRFKPSSAGGVDELVLPSSSTAAREICSAMSCCSLCSSETVARSFFRDASWYFWYEVSEQREVWRDRKIETYSFSESLRAAINPSKEPAFLRFIYFGDTRSP